MEVRFRVCEKERGRKTRKKKKREGEREREGEGKRIEETREIQEEKTLHLNPDDLTPEYKHC